MSQQYYEELCEILEFAEETFGEVSAQFRSEVSLYGDAWPGAQEDVHKARQEVERLRALVKSQPEYILAAASTPTDMDIPY